MGVKYADTVEKVKETDHLVDPSDILGLQHAKYKKSLYSQSLN